jgi:hypothetical protein
MNDIKDFSEMARDVHKDNVEAVEARELEAREAYKD